MKLRFLSSLLGVLSLLSSSALANFHVMQIEQVIGSVDGNPAAQEIQLRMRVGGQTVTSSGELVAFDSSGNNPIVLLDLTSNVTNGAAGASILLATPAFNTLMSAVAGYSPDFTLTNVIPQSYLSAGKVVWESDSGTVFWSLAFGGSNYTGTNTGNSTNGTFGSAFASGLPATGAQAIQFTGLSSAASSNNATDYAYSANPDTVTNNAGSTVTVVPEAQPVALLVLGSVGLGLFCWRRRAGAALR